MSNRTDHAYVLWMEHEGDIYSPEMSLKYCTREAIEDHIWSGQYLGECYAVYSYSYYANGGTCCSEISAHIAEALSRRSLHSSLQPLAAVQSFLEGHGVDYYDEQREEERREEWKLHGPLTPPRAPTVSQSTKVKRKPKAKTPEELRAQPQFKLPIAGGKASDAQADTAITNEVGRKAG